MSDPYIGEIRMFAGNFAPVDWALCNGQLLSIAENEALFTLLGTTYGGDGSSTFGLPDLRGRVPIHRSNTYPVGQLGGTESVPLVVTQLPGHTHALMASEAPATGGAPSGAVLASPTNLFLYSQTTPSASLSSGAISTSGGNQPHENMQPFLCVNFIIALSGIFPSPN